MRRKVLIALVVILFAAAAEAQVELYVTSSTGHFSNVYTGTPPGISAQPQYSGFWASGIGGGLTVNFLPLPVVSLGLDFRGSTKPGTPGADSGQVGLRLGIHPPVIRVKPYVEAAAGYLGTRTYSVSIPARSTNNGTYVTWEILGGVDYPLMHLVDWRVIELGGGQGIIHTGPGGNASLFTINTGLVVHF